MAERPIIFSAPMVRAILDGRKTMTRRIVRLPHQNPLGAWEATTVGGDRARRADGSPVPRMPAIWHTRTGDTLTCPYGVPGDRLWVQPWKPSIHMPKRASRITLEVTGVRVERVQEISEADCMAEGVREYEYEPTGDHPRMIGYVTDADGPDEYGTAAHHTPQEAFAKLWDSVNGPGAWERNDWVWVVEFRPL